MPAYYGNYDLPWNPNPGDSFAGEQLRGNFNTSFDALLQHFMPQFQGTNFFDWFSGQGRRQAENQFNQQNAGILAGGGGIFDMIDPLDFLKAWNPGAAFNQMAPRDRGEQPQGAMTPFTRFLG